MLGRGAATDITSTDINGTLLHGGNRYVQIVGSRRLSTELGNLVESVNSKPEYQFHLDDVLDPHGPLQSIYCRSDHTTYAARGIPVAFFTTGDHQDDISSLTSRHTFAMTTWRCSIT